MQAFLIMENRRVTARRPALQKKIKKFKLKRKWQQRVTRLPRNAGRTAEMIKYQDWFEGYIFTSYLKYVWLFRADATTLLGEVFNVCVRWLRNNTGLHAVSTSMQIFFSINTAQHCKWIFLMTFLTTFSSPYLTVKIQYIIHITQDVLTNCLHYLQVFQSTAGY